jgi:DNA ligase (NAD+)
MKFLVPETIPYKGKVQIRGEILIDKVLWDKKYNRPEPGKISNPRNFVAGFLNRDEYNISEVKDLIYVAYNILCFDENGKSFHIDNTMTTLKEWGFNKTYDPIIINFKPDDFESMYYQMKQYREECPYLIDGIVIKYPENLREKMGETSHHPKWAMAIKFPTELSITTINDIEWTIAKTGDLCPKAILEPVELLGTMVTKASLSNLGNIIRLRAFPGAKVSLKKSGEIIPMIVRVLEPSPNEDAYMKEYEEFLSSCA